MGGSIFLWCFAAGAGLLLTVMILIIRQDILSIEASPYETKRNNMCRYNKYVKVAPETAITLIKNGLDIYKDRGLYYFQQLVRNEDGVAVFRRDVYFFWTYKESRKFESLLNTYDKEKERQEIAENNDSDAYLYLIQQANEAAAQHEKEAQRCADAAAETYARISKNLKER